MVLLLLLTGCQAAKISLGDDGTGMGDTGGETDTDRGGDDSAGTDDTAETGDTGGPALPQWDIEVDCNGGADFRTIQEAIDAATSGDRIGLDPCEYHERIDYLGKYLDIFGIEGSASTVIDGDGQGTVVNIETAESDGTRLAGVTVRGGYDPAAGSAMEIEYAAVSLDDVVFEDNYDGWAVVWSTVGLVDMVDVSVTGNTVVAGGQAVLIDGGSLSATRLDADCGAGTYALYMHTAVLLLDSTFTCDAGYGVYSYHGEIQAKRSRMEGGISGVFAQDEEDNPSERTILYNCAVGGGSVGADISLETANIANSVLWGADAAVRFSANDPSSWVISSVLVGGACGISADVTTYTAANNAFWNDTENTCGMTASGSVTADPQFTSWPDDLTIAATSPLVDAGYNSSGWRDTDGTRNDIGITGGPWAE